MNNSGSSADWKHKYLESLDQQEAAERQQKKLLALLLRAVLRISMLAEGVDRALDKQLAGMRKVLREDKLSARDLETVVSALDGQVKRLDALKSERGKSLQGSMQSMVRQLATLKPEKTLQTELKRLQKSLKSRTGHVQEFVQLLGELSELQQQVAGGPAAPGGGPFWKAWFGGDQLAGLDVGGKAESKSRADELEGGSSTDAAGAETTESQPVGGLLDDALDVGAAADLSAELAPGRVALPASDGPEPPFSRLNLAVCEVLNELPD